MSIYCFSGCYNAPLPDDRTPTVAVLSLDQAGTELSLVQQVDLPKGTLMPIAQAINKSRTMLFTTAGKHGVVSFRLDPTRNGEISGPPVGSPVSAEVLETPYGVMPVDICLDKNEEKLFSCNFLSGSLSVLTLDGARGTLEDPQNCFLQSSGIPEKVRRLGPSEAAQELGFPEGFPEDASHPHGLAIHPAGGWLVACDLGTSLFSIFKIPVGKSFLTGSPDFLLKAHQAPDSNRHDGAGPRQIRFSADGRFLFSVNELDHTVSSYHFDDTTGRLTPAGLPQKTIPQDWLDGIPPRPYLYNAQPNYNSGIAIAPDGRHVYTSARGHDSIAVFNIRSDGSLTPTPQFVLASGGRTPWAISFLNNEMLLVND